MRALAVAATLLVTATAHAGAPSKPGDYQETLEVEGVQRKYTLHVPKGYDGATAMPLLLVLHGHGGTGPSMVKSTGFNAIADKEGFIVVYPTATEDSEGKPAWNTGFHSDNGVTADDMQFLDKLIEKLEKQLQIKAKRVYVTGFSNGAFMCHRLASERPSVFAAAACVSGSVGSSPDQGATWNDFTSTAPIPVMIMHGKKDETVYYEGTKPGSDRTVRSFDETRKFWKTADGCTGKPARTTSDGGNIITQTFASSVCSSRKMVVAVTIVSGTHQWPRLDNNAKYDGSKRIWKFFSGKSL